MVSPRNRVRFRGRAVKQEEKEEAVEVEVLRLEVQEGQRESFPGRAASDRAQPASEVVFPRRDPAGGRRQ